MAIRWNRVCSVCGKHKPIKGGKQQGRIVATWVCKDCLAAPNIRTNKYNARRTPYAGVTYDSAAEATYARQLDMLAGQVVSSWQRQVKIPLGPDDSLRVDFVVTYMSGITEAVDVKGCETRDFARKVRLWQKYGPMPLCIVRRRGEKFVVSRTIGGPGNAETKP